MFKTYEAINGEKFVFKGNGSTCAIMRTCTIQIPLTTRKVLTLKGVCHIPCLRMILISFKKLDNRGFQITFDSQKVIISKNGSLVGKGYAND